jgi:hypothetical protein
VLNFCSLLVGLLNRLKLKLLYTFAGGFYTYSIFALLFWETRRKDFGVSMAHHVATLALILISYMCRFSRAGSMVLALHDASDVFLEIGKLTKYCGSEIVPSISFLIFALSWLILRLIYFPFFIIWSTRYVILIAMLDGCLWLVCLSNIPAPCSLCKCLSTVFIVCLQLQGQYLKGFLLASDNKKWFSIHISPSPSLLQPLEAFL